MPIEAEVISKLRSLVEVEPKPTDSLALIGLDSVALAELTFELEKSFGVRFDDEIVDIRNGKRTGGLCSQKKRTHLV